MLRKKFGRFMGALGVGMTLAGEGHAAEPKAGERMHQDAAAEVTPEVAKQHYQELRAAYQGSDGWYLDVQKTKEMRDRFRNDREIVDKLSPMQAAEFQRMYAYTIDLAVTSEFGVPDKFAGEGEWRLTDESVAQMSEASRREAVQDLHEAWRQAHDARLTFEKHRDDPDSSALLRKAELLETGVRRGLNVLVASQPEVVAAKEAALQSVIADLEKLDARAQMTTGTIEKGGTKSALMFVDFLTTSGTEEVALSLEYDAIDGDVKYDVRLGSNSPLLEPLTLMLATHPGMTEINPGH